MSLFQTIASRVAVNLLGGQVNVGLSQTGGLRVSTFDAFYMEAVREGRRYGLGPKAAITGIAPAQTIQTTAPQWAIFNLSATKTMFFTALGASLTGGTAGATGYSVSYCVYTLPANTAGFDSGLAVQNLSATTAQTSAVTCKSAVTITTPAAPVWCPVAQSPHIGAAASVNLVVGNWQIFGSVAIAPNSGLGLNVYGATGTAPLFAPIAEWIEVESTMY